jgi:uncharacterized protein (TIGR02145 family)
MNCKNALGFFLIIGLVLTDLQAQTVKDIDGNEYQTVKLGTQTWMKENLRVTKYSNGDVIGTTTPDSINICSQTAPKYQWACEGKEGNVAYYGRLYTWYVVADSRNVCPAGWHVPDNAEWMTLKKYLHVNESDTLNKHEVANVNGFKGIYSGSRSCSGGFTSMDSGGYCWWSSSKSDNESQTSSSRRLGCFAHFLREYNEEQDGNPVRCVKN